MIGKLDEALGFQEAALSLRAQRQQLLASNIANADTPNYKARDIDFNQALQQAVSKGTPQAAGLLRTSAAHLAPTAGAGNAIATIAGSTPLMYRTVQQGAVDGNTVDMDVERNQFTDNALRYEAGVTLISAQIKNLLSVIQG
jgi:flagellar basal-body rod protein FlgB